MKEKQSPGSLGVAIDLLAIVAIRGYTLSPVHDWVIDRIHVFIWILPVLHCVVLGIWIGKALGNQPDTSQWVGQMGLGKVTKGIFYYSVGCVMLFGWFAGIGWPLIMRYDGASSYAFLYLIIGVVIPAIIGSSQMYAEQKDYNWGKTLNAFIRVCSFFEGQKHRLILYGLTLSYTILLECMLFSGPRVTGQLGLTASIILAFCSFFPIRYMMFFLTSGNRWELLSISLSSAHLIYVMATAPGVINYGIEIGQK